MKQIEQIFPSLTWRIRHETMYPDKEFDFIKLPNDFEGYHLGLYLNHTLVGVVSVFIYSHEAQFRKLAILPKHQLCGLGSDLLQHLFIFCKAQKITTLWCNARYNAINFYQKLGLTTTGEVFYKNEIQYIKMQITF